jgi:hypothetical protein
MYVASGTRPGLRAVDSGPSVALLRVLRGESDDATRTCLHATAMNSAFRAALRTTGSVRQNSLHEFLR